jgi:hypothetical protein
MKFQVVISGIIISALFACNSGGKYGKTFEAGSPTSVDKAITDFKAGKTGALVVSGSISAVCQSEGCWFNYKAAEGDVMVDFDLKFTIPKTVSGKTAVSHGEFAYDTTTVAQLREYAKDDGKSEKEQMAITEPEIRLVFRADGVVIK